MSKYDEAIRRLSDMANRLKFELSNLSIKISDINECIIEKEAELSQIEAGLSALEKAKMDESVSLIN